MLFDISYHKPTSKLALFSAYSVISVKGEQACPVFQNDTPLGIS